MQLQSRLIGMPTGTTATAFKYIGYWSQLYKITFPSLDYKTHECIRSCKANASPRTCEYQFVVETYRTMSKACFKCPFNQTDCFRPHCVPADGFDRGILTVNRMMPGPSIQVSNVFENSNFAQFCLHYSSSFPLNVTHAAKRNTDW